ncbi:helix-turn-helix domain-containing protein [Paenibacillus aurantiacus]|uniref:Helix-turn-helix domain-containing protein n=1 Tax=Paenibacillus aurantiacus TaxID=1936118 RepID=A0ABV5KYX5_9BACL
MKPLRKQFKPGSPFMFDIAYRETKSSHTELPEHFHDWYEIVHIHAGSGTFFIDQTLYDVKPGDLFLIPGDTIHRALPDAADPVVATSLYFSPLLIPPNIYGDGFSYLDAFEQSKLVKQYQLDTRTYRDTIEQQFERIEEELSEKRPGCRQAVQLALQHLLLVLARHTTPANAVASVPAGHVWPWIGQALQYIEEHLFADIHLPQLAREAAVSPSHFSRVFKQLTGMNVTEYILTKRILSAKELLSRTDDKISDIAAQCGFESLPYFHKKFKAVTGSTPSRFRRLTLNFPT